MASSKIPICPNSELRDPRASEVPKAPLSGSGTWGVCVRSAKVGHFPHNHSGRRGAAKRRRFSGPLQGPDARRNIHEDTQSQSKASKSLAATLPGSLERNGLCTFFSSDGLYMMSSGQRLEQRALPWQDHDECLSLQTEQPHTLSGRRGVCPSTHWVKNSRAFL